MYNLSNSLSGGKGILRRSFLIFFLFIIPALICLSSQYAFAKSGKLVGNVIDFETGDPIIGATIMLQDTNIGAASNLDGNFIVNKIPAGVYVIQVSSIGYNSLAIEEFEISDDQSLTLNFTLYPKTQHIQKIVVTAKALKNTEATMLKERKRSISISDAISSEAFSRSGSGDAAEALTKVTGVSVVGGQFVYIRGLGGRYGNTSLNGISIPTPDPDQQSVPVDLFPTNLLDNIVVEKTFTPDKPGNFSGGNVDLRTKDLPEALTLAFSSSASYNSNTTFNGDFLSTSRGSKDWLGYDDGTRNIPDILLAENAYIPTIASAMNNLDSALYLEELTKSFITSMKPVRRKAPVNQSYSASFGNSYMIGEHPLSLLASLTYHHSFSYYENGKVGRWTLSGGDATVLSKDYLINDSKGNEEILWGGLANISYPFHQNHKISSQFVYNRQGKNEVRYLVGELASDGLVDDRWFEHRAISYKSQSIASLQLNGEHFFKPLRAEWTASITKSQRDEPDSKQFSNDVYEYVESVDPVTGDTTYGHSYSVRANIFALPLRFYREVEESNREAKLDFKLPIAKMNGQDLKFSFGTAYLKKDRSLNETKYKFKNPSTAGYFGEDPDNPGSSDPDDYFSDEHIGFIDSTLGGWPPRYYYNIGTVIERTIDPRNNFDGNLETIAGYGMINMRLLSDLNFVGGVRYETTNMSIITEEMDGKGEEQGLIDDANLLPSASLVYSLNDDINLRLAYGRTLARPTIRELSPMWTQEFDHGFIFVGNPDLTHTLIDNYDIRWEWFNAPGKILAVSGFYKRFRDPIERAIISNNYVVTYKNVNKAEVIGAEFEIRQSLGFLTNRLCNFSVEGNLTLTNSKVNIGDYELSVRRYFDSTASDTRPLQGQSPYLLNLNLSFNSMKSGTNATILLNLFGDRLSEVSEGGTPDVYERSRAQLDFTFSQKLTSALRLKFSGKNLLDAGINKTIEYKGTDYIFQEYSTGTSFSIGLSYQI